MATTTTLTVEAELTYTDYTTRTYKIPLKSEAANNIVTQVKTFNAAATNPNSSVAKTFISENGAPVGSITNVVTVQRTEEDIYHA